MKLIQILADIICNTLLDPEALDRSRNRKGAFTRNCGKLPYWTLIKLLLKNVKKTISASLEIPLPNRKALLEKYGSSGRGSSSPTAIASVAF